MPNKSYVKNLDSEALRFCTELDAFETKKNLRTVRTAARELGLLIAPRLVKLVKATSDRVWICRPCHCWCVLKGVLL